MNFKAESSRSENNSSQVWNTLVQVYQEFATESTVHGIKYTTQARTTIERLIWLTVVIISLFAAGELATQFYDRHGKANMRTTVVTNQYPSLKLALPAVTICQENLVSFERLSQYLNGEKKIRVPEGLSMSDFDRGVHYLSEMIYPSNDHPEEMTKLQRILDANHMNLVDLLKRLSPNCSDFLMTCVYEGHNKLCDELFDSIVTPLGICCSFNYHQLQTIFKTTSKRNLYSINFGSLYILSVLLKPFNSTDQLASINYSYGFKVIIHERYTLPGPNAVEFMAGAGYETIVGLHGTYLTSSDEILKLPDAQRECRTSTVDNRYRSENCYLECRNLLVLKHCECIPFFVDKVDNVEYCNLTHIPCLAKINPELHSLTLRHYPQCDCLPDCKSTRYTVSVTGEPMDAAIFKPGLFFEQAQKHPNSTALHITFAGQAAVLERRELVLSWINLVSSLGGVFSLFLGCSFISVIEFFYFFFYQLIKKLQIKYKNYSTVIESKEIN